MRNQQELMTELERIAECFKTQEVKLEGNVVELMFLYEVQPILLHELAEIDVPREAPSWAQKLMYLARRVMRCVREGYMVLRRLDQWDVRLRDGTRIFHLKGVDHELFSVFLDRLAAASLLKLTPESPA